MSTHPRNTYHILDRTLFYFSWVIIGTLLLRVANNAFLWVEVAPWIEQWGFPILSSAAVGYITNWLAILMLFKPYERKFGIFQGVIPREKANLAIGLSHEIPRHLLNEEQMANEISELIRATLQKETIREELKVQFKIYAHENKHTIVEGTTDKIIQHLNAQNFIKIFPKLRNVISGQLEKMFENLLEDQDMIDHTAREIIERVEIFVQKYLQNEGKDAILNQLNLSKRIENAVNDMDVKQLHTMINDISGKHLTIIQILGFILGAIVGFILALA